MHPHGTPLLSPRRDYVVVGLQRGPQFGKIGGLELRDFRQGRRRIELGEAAAEAALAHRRRLPLAGSVSAYCTPEQHSRENDLVKWWLR